jgi:glycerol-1-phosphate dehydrogenase [NAD(P)+]
MPTTALKSFGGLDLLRSKHTLDSGLARAREMSPGLSLRALYVGKDAAVELASFSKHATGPRILLVSDENTRAVAGEAVIKALRESGKDVLEKIYGKKPLDATDTLGDDVAAAGIQCDAYVAIGAGTLCDLAKHAGTKQNKPVLLYATAASMNGYTSGITALKVKGLKRTTPCTPAAGVWADPAVVAAAPPRMAASGVGDFLSKGSSASDWRTAHFLRGEKYSEEAMEFYNGVQETVFDSAAAVGRGDAQAIATVLEALLLSGLSMLIAGSSAPASGGEHLISHYLDMKQAMYGTSHDLHGVQVGVATVHCLRLWEKVLAINAADIDVERLVKQHPSPEQIDAWIDEDWHGPVADEVRQQWKLKALDSEKLRAELTRLKSGIDELKHLVRQQFIPSSAVAKAIEDSGGPTEPQGMTAPIEEYRKALLRARYIRSRFTILDLAAELGLT